MALAQLTPEARPSLEVLENANMKKAVLSLFSDILFFPNFRCFAF